jgi:hypothetical protein
MDIAPRKGGAVTKLPKGTTPTTAWAGLTGSDVNTILMVVGAVLSAVSLIIGLLVNFGVIKISSARKI